MKKHTLIELHLSYDVDATLRGIIEEHLDIELIESIDREMGGCERMNAIIIIDACLQHEISGSDKVFGYYLS